MTESCCGIRCEVLSGHTRHLAGVRAAAFSYLWHGYGLQTKCLQNEFAVTSAPPRGPPAGELTVRGNSRILDRASLSLVDVSMIKSIGNLILLTILFHCGSAQTISGAGAQPRTPSPTNVAFQTADVHASPATPYPAFLHDGYLVGDRYVLRQATMLDMISIAYGVDKKHVQGDRVARLGSVRRDRPSPAPHTSCSRQADASVAAKGPIQTGSP